MSTAARSTEDEPQFFGHPRGLSTLFFTEMWERFSYYGMRGILVLYMVDAIRTGGMGLTDSKAAAIYGMYVAGVYLLALPGGWVADRIIGQQRAVFVGGCIIAAGHFCMAVPYTPMFFGGLMLIVIGTGLLKPNVSAIVGQLYPEGGARRDAGFSIFYMGINIGAFAGPLLVGYLGENVNWHLGFSIAGVGMVLGLIQYRWGMPYLKQAGVVSERSDEERSANIRKLQIGIATAAGALGLVWLLTTLGLFPVTLEGAAQATGVFIATVVVGYFGFVLFMGELTPVEQRRLGLIFLLVVGAALFWSGFEQAGSSLNLFAERLTNRTVFGWEAPASWLQSVNPLFIIIFAPVVGTIWVALGSRQPSIPVKFGMGLVLLGAGFLVLAWGATYSVDGHLVSPMWLVVTYFLHTVGELTLSPVGLSSVTKLAPPKYVGQMMGIWFTGTALGNLIAGLAAGLETLPVTQLFLTVGSLVIGFGLIYLIFSKPMKWLAQGVE